jgi:hypothetical protein
MVGRTGSQAHLFSSSITFARRALSAGLIGRSRASLDVMNQNFKGDVSQIPRMKVLMFHPQASAPATGPLRIR